MFVDEYAEPMHQASRHEYIGRSIALEIRDAHAIRCSKTSHQSVDCFSAVIEYARRELQETDHG
jgi:hypothetical protein